VKKNDYTKHFKPLTADKLQPTKARCPTQDTIGVLCLCVEDFAIHNFRPFPGDFLLISSKGLLDHWRNELCQQYNKGYHLILRTPRPYRPRIRHVPPPSRQKQQKVQSRLAQKHGIFPKPTDYKTRSGVCLVLYRGRPR